MQTRDSTGSYFKSISEMHFKCKLCFFMCLCCHYHHSAACQCCVCFHTKPAREEAPRAPLHQRVKSSNCF